MNKYYANSDVWDKRFGREGDLDWGGLWTDPFIDMLQGNGCRNILDLGCGTGNDLIRLANAGLQVTGLDFSPKALEIARNKCNKIKDITIVQADMARSLPFEDRSYDVVMSNVALHMFDSDITKQIVREIERILNPKKYFIFHVNSTQDQCLRAKRRKPLRKLNENVILEEDGQTMRFFSREDLESLFKNWESLQIEHLVIPDKYTGEPFKMVWRGIAINHI